MVAKFFIFHFFYINYLAFVTNKQLKNETEQNRIAQYLFNSR